MDVGHAGSGLLRVQQDLVKFRMPIFFPRYGVDGDTGNVFRNQVIERRWSGFVIERKLLNRISHDEEVLLERGFFGALDRFLVSCRCDARQDHDNGDDDHDFEQSESGRTKTSSRA